LEVTRNVVLDANRAVFKRQIECVRRRRRRDSDRETGKSGGFREQVKRERRRGLG